MSNPIKAYRDANAMTQVELGRRLGVDGMTVSRWERGDHLPRKTMWPIIEEATGIAPSELIAHIKTSEAAQ